MKEEIEIHCKTCHFFKNNICGLNLLFTFEDFLCSAWVKKGDKDGAIEQLQKNIVKTVKKLGYSCFL